MALAGCGEFEREAPVLSGENDPQRLALTSDRAYWVAGGVIRSVSKTGSTAADVVGAAVSAFAVDDSGLYWSERTGEVPSWDGSYRISSQTSEGVVELAIVGGEPYAMQLDASHLYWLSADDSGMALLRMLRSGGGVEMLTSASFGCCTYGPGESRDLALDATHVYFLENQSGSGYDSGATIVKLAKQSGAGSLPERLADVIRVSTGLVLDDDYLYWGTMLGPLFTNRIVRLLKSGGAPATIVRASEDHEPQVASLARDSERLWWTADVYYLPAADPGSSPIRRARLEAFGGEEIAVDSSAVFVLARYDGALFRVER
jgi:hypothetical protein